ncbi:MAG TPA: S53 family peptidase [Acidimicrobiales bacterium]|nr:S53 family peptidase [Acidimicrobiales bacterium]
MRIHAVKTRRARSVATLAAACALGLSPGASAAPVLAPRTPVSLTGAALAGVAVPSLRLQGATDLGPVPSGEHVQLSIALQLRHRALMRRLLSEGKSVDGAVYAEEFGPAPATAHAVEGWLKAAGFDVSWAPGSPVLEARGTARSARTAFHVRIDRYALPRHFASNAGDAGAPVFAPHGRPLAPKALARSIISVLGLDDLPVPAAINDGAGQCPGVSKPQEDGGFTPRRVAEFYSFEPLYAKGLRGDGQTVVFMETDGYTAADLATYAHGFGLPAFEVAGPLHSSAWGTPTPVPYGGACGTETELDLEVVHAMAPEAKLVVYEAGQPDNGYALADVATSLAAAVRTYPTAIYNLSLGWCEDGASARQFDELFSELSLRGGSAFVASGDSGAFDRSCPAHVLSVSEPGDSPDATAVGGTTALMGEGGAYGEEAAWGGPFEQWGTGGGLSGVFRRPSWQAGPGVENRFSNGMRQEPDVSAIADSDTGWDTFGGGTWSVTGGTSAAAPLWAALGALADEALAQRYLPPIGEANPALYDFGAHPSRFPAPAFHPVTQGGNLYYRATSPGWNYGTGWGTPIASAVVDDFIAYKSRAR